MGCFFILRNEVNDMSIPACAPLCVGDVVTRRPTIFSDTRKEDSELKRGKVVYVHPGGRFHIVEFEAGDSAVRESFTGVER